MPDNSQPSSEGLQEKKDITSDKNQHGNTTWLRAIEPALVLTLAAFIIYITWALYCYNFF
jgi:hypothetical protein